MAAKSRVAALASELGLEPVDTGPLLAARYLEAMTRLSFGYLLYSGKSFEFHLAPVTPAGRGCSAALEIQRLYQSFLTETPTRLPFTSAFSGSNPTPLKLLRNGGGSLNRFSATSSTLTPSNRDPRPSPIA